MKLVSLWGARSSLRDRPRSSSTGFIKMVCSGVGGIRHIVYEWGLYNSSLLYLYLYNTFMAEMSVQTDHAQKQRTSIRIYTRYK